MYLQICQARKDKKDCFLGKISFIVVLGTKKDCALGKISFIVVLDSILGIVQLRLIYLSTEVIEFQVHNSSERLAL